MHIKLKVILDLDTIVCLIRTLMYGEIEIHATQCQTTQNAVQGCVAPPVDIKWHLLVSVGVCWCLLVSDGVFQCPMVSGDLRRVSEELLKGYLCAVYGLV